MKKIVKIMAIISSAGLLVACSNNKDSEKETTQSSSHTTSNVSTTKSTEALTLTSTTISEIAASTESTESSETSNTASLFDQLSLPERIVLYAQTEDNRVEDYPGLKGLGLNYYIDGTDLYFQIHSGAGVGHPIFHLKITEDGVKGIQGICYEGTSGYSPQPVNLDVITKETLYQYYLDHQQNIEESANKVVENQNIKQGFYASLQAGGVSESSVGDNEKND